MLIISINGFLIGNPRVLGIPHDNEGNYCAISPNYESFKFILYPEKDNYNYFICVENCPEKAPYTIKCNCKFN